MSTTGLSGLVTRSHASERAFYSAFYRGESVDGACSCFASSFAPLNIARAAQDATATAASILGASIAASKEEGGGMLGFSLCLERRLERK